MNRPKFDHVPLWDEVWEASFAKLLLECYRNGFCLHCTSRIEDAGRDGEPGKEEQRILRSLLGLFDRTGEPIPRELRKWSEESRFQKPPPGGRGRPGQNWLRDRCIIHTVASLAYLTGRDATRSDASEPESPCDAVASVLRENGWCRFFYDAAKTVWYETKDKKDGVVLGPAMLKRWREQDQEEERALPVRQRDGRRPRAEPRWARLAYWREQDWWEGL